MKFKFELNTKVEDKVTNFQGVILVRSEYATGCIHYGVAPTSLDKDGKIQEWEHFDESRLILVGDSKINKLKSKGGPAPKVPDIN